MKPLRVISGSVLPVGLSMFAFASAKLYPQAPHEEVATPPPEETLWNELISKFTPVDYPVMKEQKDGTNLQVEVAGAGGSCDVV